MKSNRLSTMLGALVAAVGVLLGVPNRSEAAIRLTITSGASTKVFYAESSNSGSALTFTIGDYTGNTQISTTNYAGSAVLGTITQSFNVGSIASGAGLSPTLVSTVDIIAQVAALDGVLPAGLLQDVTGNAAVTGAAILSWALPLGPGFTATADAGSSINSSVASGSNMSENIFNGAVVVSATQASIVSPPDPFASTFLPGATAPYTLSNRMTLMGVNRSAEQFSVTSTVGVTAIPEPASIAMAITGAPLLGLLWLRRRAKA